MDREHAAMLARRWLYHVILENQWCGSAIMSLELPASFCSRIRSLISAMKCEVCQGLIAAYHAAVKAYSEASHDPLGDTFEQQRQERERLREACHRAKHELHTHALSDRLISRSRGFEDPKKVGLLPAWW